MTPALVADSWRRSPWGTVAGFVLAGTIGVALVGPWLAPHSPTDIVGVPYRAPAFGEGPRLGTDDLGRDVLSRILHGGRPVVLTAVATTLIGTVLGAVLGIAAALAAGRRRWLDGLLMRPLDTVLAVPPLLLVLLVLAVAPGRSAIVLAVVVVSVPLSARVVRAAALAAVGRAHVEAAVARGEGLSWLIGRELLPFVAGPLIADAAVRFVVSVYLVAAAGFLGLSAGGADWGLLIAQALPGAELQPWALAVPVLLIATLAVSANVLADEVSRNARGLLA